MLLPTLVLEFGASLSTSPAAFGLCITYALDLSAFLKFGTKMTLDIQRGMAGVERILECAIYISHNALGLGVGVGILECAHNALGLGVGVGILECAHEGQG